MKTNRKMAIIASHVKMEDEDALDVVYWLSKTPSERLAEVYRFRRNYFSWADDSFPEKMEKVVDQIKLNVEQELNSINLI